MAWDGLIVPVDSDWVKTHYPPNGYGCKCTMLALSERDLQRYGKPLDPKLTAWTDPNTGKRHSLDPPDDGTYDWVDKATGEWHTFPKGVQPFWDYAPGASLSAQATTAVAHKLTQWDAPLGAPLWAGLPVLQQALASQFAQWVDQTIASGQAKKSVQIVGAIQEDVLAALDKLPATAEIAVQDRLLVGKKAERHQAAGDALTAAEWKSLPVLLAHKPKALLDNDTGKVLYVLPSVGSKTIKLVVELDYKAKKSGTLIVVRTAFKIDGQTLEDRRRYKPLN